MKKEMRLDRILAHMGRGTRSEIRKIMKKGLVTVDGEAVTDGALKLDPAEHLIKAAGEVVVYQEHIYLMLNKPAGCVSATEDERDRTVLDLLSPEHRVFSPFPVGRLDKDTEGLLLLTNDGAFAHKITAPKKKVSKTYCAVVTGVADHADAEAFAAGVVLDDGYKTKPAELTIIESGAQSRVELVIYEGRFHQVKRMFKGRGKEVISLKRLKIGRLQLDENLKPGEYRPLTEEELAML